MLTSIGCIHVNALEDRAKAYAIVDQLALIIKAIQAVNPKYLSKRFTTNKETLEKSERKTAAAASSLVEESPRVTLLAASEILVDLLAATKAERPSIVKMLPLWPYLALRKMRARELAARGNSKLTDAIEAEGRAISDWSREKEREVAGEFAAFAAEAKKKLGVKTKLVTNKDGLPMPFLPPGSRTRNACDLAYRGYVRLLEECDEEADEDGVEVGVGEAIREALEWLGDSDTPPISTSPSFRILSCSNPTSNRESTPFFHQPHLQSKHTSKTCSRHGRPAIRVPGLPLQHDVTLML